MRTRIVRLEKRVQQFKNVRPLLRRHKQDAALWTEERLDFLPDEWQGQFLQSEAKRALLVCGRQVGKSSVTAAKMLHTMLYFAPALCLVVAPALRQSSEIARKLFDFYFSLEAPVPYVRKTILSLELLNGSRVLVLPGHNPATIRGFSAVAALALDEAAYVPDTTFTAIKPALAVSDGSIVACGTPGGKRGWLWSEWNGTGNWERYHVPTSQCPRVSSQFLAEEQALLAPMWFEQEYNAAFVDPVGAVFTESLIQSAFSSDIEPLFQEAA